jgi:hypothetical protein
MADNNKLNIEHDAVHSMTGSLRRIATAATAMELCADLIGDHATGTEDQAHPELLDQSFYGIEAVLRLATCALFEETECLENLTGFHRFRAGTAFKVKGEGA